MIRWDQPLFDLTAYVGIESCGDLLNVRLPWGWRVEASRESAAVNREYMTSGTPNGRSTCHETK